MAVNIKSITTFRAACPGIDCLSYSRFLVDILKRMTSTGSCTPGVFMKNERVLRIVCVFKPTCTPFQNLHIQTHGLLKLFFCKFRLLLSAFSWKQSKCPGESELLPREHKYRVHFHFYRLPLWTWQFPASSVNIVCIHNILCIMQYIQCKWVLPEQRHVTKTSIQALSSLLVFNNGIWSSQKRRERVRHRDYVTED